MTVEVSEHNEQAAAETAAEDTQDTSAAEQEAATGHDEQREKTDEGLAAGHEHAAPDPIEVLTKRVNDMQAWGTRLAQTNSRLKDEIAALKAGHGSQERVDTASDAAAAAQDKLDTLIEEFAADYPEGKPVLQELNATVKALRTELRTLQSEKIVQNERLIRQAQLDVFNATVKPEILKVHPDYDDVILIKNPDGTVERNDDYFAWAESQRPALRIAALDSGNPDDIIWAIGEYKKARGLAPEASAAKLQKELDRKTKVAHARTIRGSGSAVVQSPGTQYASLDELPVDEYIALRRKQERGKG